VLQVVNKLPVLNRRVLHYLVDFLRRFAEPAAEAKTKMTASNLATVFAPNLLRAPDNQVPALSAARFLCKLNWSVPLPQVSLENARLEQDFVRTVLLHWTG
jgi:hypothetical protein